MIHNRTYSLMALISILALATLAFAGQAVEIKLKDGSRWRGEVGSVVQMSYLQQSVQVPLEGKLIKVEPLYIVVEGTVAGSTRQVTVFRSDIVSMKTLSEAAGGETPQASAETPKTSGEANVPQKSQASKADPTQPGVFVLPMEGMVGMTFRHEEVEKLNEYLDKKYPPGQIVILLINSDGGSSPETTKIGTAIQQMRKKHRVIAWINKAISAGCHTAMYCNEIYFMTQGTCGGVTTWNMGTGQAARGEVLEKILAEFVKVAEENGYSKYVALAMKLNQYMCSYDKDPVTGEVTFYGDLSGQYILSDDKSNLCFNASTALHCGFSDGTADTPEELAKLLNLPKWNEVDDYGRKIAKEWQRTCELAQQEIPLALARYGYKNRGSGDAVVVLGTQVQIIEELIGWWNRCYNVCAMSGLPPKEELERELAELKKQLADIRRQNGR